MNKHAASLLVSVVIALGFCAAPVEAYHVFINFSGYTWQVKDSAGKVGPGPNYFSSGANNVWVDATGRLHMKITKTRNRWNCAEVICTNSFGYGTYRFVLDSRVDNLDTSVVLGLFTWNDLPDYNHRELDIEFARWGSANNLNAQYVVQPYTDSRNIVRFNQPAGFSTHSFTWQTGSVSFLSLLDNPPNPSTIVRSWTAANGIPVPGGENPRINLWLFRGRAPTNRQEVEIIINRFEFVAP